MNWNLAVEKNHEALKRILAMLVAMIGTAGAGPSTLPRHLHRYMQRLLRPAEAATRRLIIIAARGLLVTLPAPNPSMRKPVPAGTSTPDRVSFGIGLMPLMLRKLEYAMRAPNTLTRVASFSLFDTMKRSSLASRNAQQGPVSDTGRIDNMRIFRLVPIGSPTPRSADDLIDAACLQQRLDALGLALDDLPEQAMRMARWLARRDARWEGDKARNQSNDLPSVRGARPPLRLATLGTYPPIDGGEEARLQGLAPFLYPSEAGGEVDRAKPETEWGDYGLRVGATANSCHTPPKHHIRQHLVRPGCPPGWRKCVGHGVELHGLAIWARERRDSS